MPTNALNPDFIGALAAIGITNVLPEEISLTVSNWDWQIATQTATEVISFPSAAPTGPPYFPPGRPHCTDPARQYAFGGRDIIFVHGLQLKHIADKITFNPGASKTWVAPTHFPASAENPEFYGSGYFKTVADHNWALHIQKFLVSKGYQNRYLTVAYPCAERLEVGAQAVLTQISDAMHFGTGVVDLSGDGDVSKFGTPSFVIVAHSTGTLITDAAMSAAAQHPNLGAAYIPRLCKAVVALDGVFSGSELATAGIALSGFIGQQSSQWGCPLAVWCLNGLSNDGYGWDCGQIGPIFAQSILVDLVPLVTQTKWKPYIQTMPVRTLTVVGGHPTMLQPIKYLLQPGFDDGVTTINSQVANPNSRLLWPSGITPGGVLPLIKAFDMGVMGDGFPATPGSGSAPTLDSPHRALGYYLDQVLEPERRVPPNALIAGGATPYLSPSGMRQNVAYDYAGTSFSTLNRYPNHFSFIQSASDHFTGYSGSVGGFNGQEYFDTAGVEPNKEESRVITDPAVYAPFAMWYPGDDAPLLTKECVPKVQTWERGRYIPAIEFQIFHHHFKFGPWWIWRRVYDLLENWENKMGCDYVYESVLRCPPLATCPTCIAPPPDLALWLPFDETSGSTAYNVAGGFNGTLYHGTVVATGASGPTHILPLNPDYHLDPTTSYDQSGLCFDGANDSVSVPSYNGINVGIGDFTLDAWVKLDPNFGTAARTILDKTAISVDGVRGYRLAVAQGNLVLFMSDLNGGSYRDTGIVPNDGLWHFVAVTVDRSDPAGIRFYVDGQPTGVFDPTPAPGSLDTASPLSVGRPPYYYSGALLWLGCLDEVELFRRALSPAEVQSLYAARWQGKCKFACHASNGTLCLSSNSVTTSAQFCNYTAIPQTLNYSFQGCAGAPNLTFVPASGSALVQAGQCATVPVTIYSSAGFCYQVTMQPAGFSETYQATGRVSQIDEYCFPPPVSPTATVVGTNNAVSFSGFRLVNNSGTNQTVQYRWQVLNSFGLPDTNHVRLNGCPPACPVLCDCPTAISLPAGSTTNLAISARFILPDPLGFYNVVLETLVNGVWVVVASESLRYVDLPSEQPPMTISVSGTNLVISWNASGPCHVQSATSVQGDATTWTDMPGLSPVTTAITGGSQYLPLSLSVSRTLALRMGRQTGPAASDRSNKRCRVVERPPCPAPLAGWVSRMAIAARASNGFSCYAMFGEISNHLACRDDSVHELADAHQRRRQPAGTTNPW